MRVLQINTVYGQGSTGKIVKAIHDMAQDEYIDCMCACRYLQTMKTSENDVVEISSKWDSRCHGLISRYTMFKGIGSCLKTAIFLKKVEKYRPDLIHLHNLHGSYINIPMLMRYIKKRKIAVIWTLHDCWPLTAICSHFTIANCNRWRDGCCACAQKRKYSSAPFDMTRYVWKLKKKWFTGIERMTIVTPSNWLANVVNKSFLNIYPIRTIYNGIDLDVFQPTDSDFKEKNGLLKKKIVLGVSFNWGYEKGLDVFIELAHLLPPNYVIILVGTNENVEKNIPKNIIPIRQTENQKQLAKIYTAADVFVNPTREEVLGLVNLEALACGTPVITFKTGGSPECVDEKCGCVVAVNDVLSMSKHILRICQEQPYDSLDCISRARHFDKQCKFAEYISLYKELM